MHSHSWLRQIYLKRTEKIKDVHLSRDAWKKIANVYIQIARGEPPFGSNDDKEVSGYITVIYDNKWYLAYTISKDSQRKEATVVFLKPHGPSKTFKYSKKENMLMPYSDILSKVDVSTKDGINYKLNSAEQKRISRMLNKKI